VGARKEAGATLGHENPQPWKIVSPSIGPRASRKPARSRPGPERLGGVVVSALTVAKRAEASPCIAPRLTMARLTP
jgi:hypothetical protein